MEWRNRDWFWVTGTLIGIMILIIAIAYSKDDGLEANFSIISSAVSIALALVAIFYAWKQDSDSRRVNDNFATMLQNVLSDVGAVKNQVDKISDSDINQLKEETIEDVKLDEQKTHYSQEEVNKILSDAMDRFSSELKTKVEMSNKVNSKDLNSSTFIRSYNINRVYKILPEIFKKHGTLPIDQIQNILLNEYDIFIKSSTLSKIIKDIE